MRPGRTHGILTERAPTLEVILENGDSMTKKEKNLHQPHIIAVAPFKSDKLAKLGILPAANRGYE